MKKNKHKEHHTFEKFNNETEKEMKDLKNDEEISASDDTSDLEKNIMDESKELQELKEQLDGLKDQFIRANADFENIKKRLEKEKESSLAYANEKFAKDLLPIVDALSQASDIDVEGNEFAQKIKDGLKSCLDIFKNTLKKYNITEIDDKGEFNPNFHNAINSIESKEHKSGDIVQVYQKGYKYNDRVLRPSMVVIAK